MTAWYHRTCDDRYVLIEEDGWTLRPYPQPVLRGMSLIWFSSSPASSRAALGLSSATLSCDRMAHLLRVVPEDEGKIAWWGDVMRADVMVPYLPGARRLMAARGSLPGTWGLASEPIRVVPVA